MAKKIEIDCPHCNESITIEIRWWDFYKVWFFGQVALVILALLFGIFFT